MSATRKVELEFHSGDETPPVRSGTYKQLIITTISDKGKSYTYAAYYLNEYPLEYEGGCDACRDGKVEHDEGCPTTGWFYDESNLEYENCYYPIRNEIVEWAHIPQNDESEPR
jgi:hypothetical protein